MTIHFNGWQRIGILLSLLWGISVCGYTANEYVKKVDASTYLIEVTHNEPTFDSQGRRTMSTEEFLGEDAKRDLKVINFLSVIIIPITLAWIIGYLCIFAYRWIMIGFKSGKPHPEQIQIVMSSPVDTNLLQAHLNIPKPPPQKRSSAMKRARNGEERLWKVFWLYNILGVLFFVSIEKFCEAFLIAAENNNQSYIGITIFMGVIVVLSILYIIWALTSLWRCAFNTGWKGWGYLGRAYVVWCGVSFIGVILTIIFHK